MLAFEVVVVVAEVGVVDETAAAGELLVVAVGLDELATDLTPKEVLGHMTLSP